MCVRCLQKGCLTLVAATIENRRVDRTGPHGKLRPVNPVAMLDVVDFTRRCQTSLNAFECLFDKFLVRLRSVVLDHLLCLIRSNELRDNYHEERIKSSTTLIVLTQIRELNTAILSIRCIDTDYDVIRLTDGAMQRLDMADVCGEK